MKRCVQVAALTLALAIQSAPASAQPVTSDVTATHLDAMIRALSADPNGKRAATILALLKGVGQQQGDTVTWHLELRGGHLFINGTDVNQFIPRKSN